MNFTKVFLLVVLTILVQSVVASFPFLGFILLWVGSGVVVDQILIKIGDAEGTRRQKSYIYALRYKNYYADCPPLRVLSFLIPPVALLVGVLSNPDDVRTAFPQIPKFHNPFYYD